MPLLDLSTAEGVRFGGQDVSVVRLNGVDLWEADAGLPPMTDRLVAGYTASAHGTASSSSIDVSLGFANATPLDDTHLLVLVLSTQIASRVLTAPGWTVHSPLISGANAIHYATKRGDGAATGFVGTFDGSGITQATRAVFAFGGFVSLDPVVTPVVASDSASTFPFDPIADTTRGVRLDITSGINAPTSWSNGTQVIAANRLGINRHVSPGAPSSVATFSSSAARITTQLVFPLV